MINKAKLKSIHLKKADANRDIALINEYSITELMPDDVCCFSVTLCDNDVDRDTERFTVAALNGLAPLFLGRPILSDHRWEADRQVARLYHTEVEKTAETTALGDPLVRLRGYAYMLNNDANADMIEAINGGIIKEGSVGCSVSQHSCSICGLPMKRDKCENNHIKGQEYDGVLCVIELSEPTDAYEFSFVAVPSQRKAGVTKACKDCPHCHNNEPGTLSESERAYRERLVEEAAEYLKTHPHISSKFPDGSDWERAKILSENKQVIADLKLRRTVAEIDSFLKGVK